MALVINTNTLANFSANSLNNIYNNLSKSVERLSTGLRVNSAADDSGALLLSEQLKSQMTGYKQGINNIQDGVSLLQTADGALSQIDIDLTRMKELAEAAATGTYDANDRLTMNSEFQEMGAEIDRLASSTSFNSINLLDGSLSAHTTWTSSGGWINPNNGVLIHFGNGTSRAKDYYYISLPNMLSTRLFSNQSLAVSTSAAAQNAISYINTAMIMKENATGYVGALENRLDTTLGDLEMKYDTLENAKSKILDTDYATEITSYLKNLVLAQSATAMLAQANTLPQLALTLLKSSV